MKSDKEDEELNMTEEELQRWVRAEVDQDEQLVRRRAQLTQVEEWVKRKEREASYTRVLYSNACESVLECESVMKGLYGMLGLEYQDTDSEEEEGAKPKENIIQIVDDDDDDDDDGEDECGDDVSADGDDDYVVIDLGAAVPDSSSEVKPKVEPSEPSVQVLGQTDKTSKAVNNVDFITVLENSPSRSPEPSSISLPIKKDRESPVPISSNPSPDALPVTSFRPISPQLKRENSPSRNPESYNNSLPTIKTRDSPEPISSPSLSDPILTSFTPIHLPPKRESSPSRSPEPSINSLPTIKTRESPLPVTSSPDLLPSGTFKPVASPTKKVVSPSRSPEPSINLLPTIKTRESPVPVSSSPDLLLSGTFKPVASPTKKVVSPSRSPEPSINLLPTIKTRESPVLVTSSPDLLLSGTFKAVASPTKKVVSPSRSPEPSNNLSSTIKTRESSLPNSSASSPDILSSLSTPISTPTPNNTTESPPLTTAPPKPSAPVNNVETIANKTSTSTEQNSETPEQPEEPSKTSASSTKSSLASTSSNKVSINQEQVSSGTCSVTPTSNAAGEKESEKAKGASVTHIIKPSSSLTSSTTTNSTATTKTTTSSTTASTTASTSAPTTTTSAKPSGANEVSQTLPARVQKEVELKVDMNVFGRRRTKTWHQGTILEIKSTASGNRYKVRFEGDKGKSVLSGHHLACVNCPMLKDLFIGCRVVARYKEDDQSWLHAAVITEMPDRKNRMRFMVFYDDGRAAYVSLPDLHLVCKPLKNIYEDIEDEGPRIEVEEYIKAYPNPIFVVARVGQESKAERDGVWEDCTVSQVDGGLIQICYTKDKEKEWLFKGSNRLEHIQRIKKRMAGQKTEQPSNKVVSVTNQGSTTTTAATTTTASSTTTTTAATTTPAAKATSETTSTRVTTQPVALRPSTPKSVPQAVATRTAAKPKSQPKVILHRINPEAYLSIVAVSKAALPTEASLSNRGTKRPAEVDFYQNVPPPVVEPRLKYVPHRCCPACLDQVRPKDKDQYRGQNPLLIPLLYGFRRMTGRKRLDGKMSFHVFYRAPCARSMCKMEEVQDFLFASRCDFLFLDMFCLDPFVLVKRAMLPSSMTSQPNLFLPDISQGKEGVPVPCVNELDSASPPPLNYTRHRVPAPGVVINTSLDFMMGCDCTDGCRDRSKCSCQQLTIEATSLSTGGSADVTAGYTNKRLTRYVPTGVYECNPLCRCDPWMCGNRLVQHGLQLRLQLFMTRHKGWGIRCLDDISKGTFVCIFTGKIVTDGMASVEANMSGNEYLANLDYIEEVEKLKEGYESEAYCSDPEQEGEKKGLVRMTTGSLKKHDSRDSSSGEEMEVSNQEEMERDERTSRRKSKTNYCENENESCSGDDEDDDLDDEDYRVSSDDAGVNRERLNDDCRRTYITRRNAKIVDVDEDIHSDFSPLIPPKLVEDQTEVSPSMAKQMRKEGPGEARMGFARKSTRNFAIKSFHRKVKQPEVPKEKPQEKKTTRCRRNTRSLFNNEKACYLIDAKDEGNIGRFINHSCSPNLFVQNVFVDTHDLRFPWVAFFASKRIRAGTELTWDYGYEVGSVEGNVLLCCCGSAECKGRLL